jgi:phospholipase C
LGIAALASLVLIAASMVAVAPAGADNGNHGGQVDPHLRGIDHLVVIYEENHSFDNLYGLWPGVDGIATPANTTPNQTQVDQGGAPYACLKQNDPKLTSPPLPASCTDPRGFASAFTNQLFGIDDHIPLDQNTEDLVHAITRSSTRSTPGRWTASRPAATPSV